jgi:hypothetical protein
LRGGGLAETRVPFDDDWYEVVQDGSKLLQGDLLSACPILRLDRDVPYPLPDEIPTIVQPADIVVLTQSCDSDQNKVTGVVCCTHFDLEEAKEKNQQLSRKNVLEEIKKGRHVRYTLLAARDAHPSIRLRIVDLGDIFVLPKTFLEKVAASQNPRLRLRTPYREHLAQAFGRFYMRVALPREPF